MKVFLLTGDDGEHICIHGVFSSKSACVASFPFNPIKLDESNILEMEVDPPNKGEPYIDGFIACADQRNGVQEQVYEVRKTRTEIENEPLSFTWNREHDCGSVSAAGKTVEEAKKKATDAIPLISPVWQVGRYICAPYALNEVRHAHPSTLYAWEKLDGHSGYAVHACLETAREILLEYEKTGNIMPGLVLPAQTASTITA